MTNAPRAKPRTLRWAGGPPTTWQEPPWDSVARGVLASGERPLNKDDLVRLRPGDRVWRVGQATHHISPSGVITATLHLVKPETTLP